MKVLLRLTLAARIGVAPVVSASLSYGTRV
jgi:hypothetical protein